MLHARTALLTVAPHAVAAAEPRRAGLGRDVRAGALRRRPRRARARPDPAAGGRRLARGREGRRHGRARRRLGRGLRARSRSWRRSSVAPSAARARSRCRAGARTPTRSARPGRRSRRRSTSPAASSGATQHIAGGKGAKRILAVNTDPEAPIMSVRGLRGDRRPARGAARGVGGAAEAAGMSPAAADVGVRRSSRPRAGHRAGPPHEHCALRRRARLVLAAGALFARRALLLTRLVRLGKPVQRFDDVPDPRAQRGRRRARARRSSSSGSVPGLIHAFIFWGFLVLFPTIVMAMIARRRPGRDAPVARPSGLVRVPRRPLLRARPRRRRVRVLDPQGAAPARASRAATSARPT